MDIPSLVSLVQGDTASKLGHAAWMHIFLIALKREDLELFDAFWRACPVSTLTEFYQLGTELLGAELPTLELLVGIKPLEGDHFGPLPDNCSIEATVPRILPTPVAPLRCNRATLWSHLLIAVACKVLDGYERKRGENVRGLLEDMQASSLARDASLALRTLNGVRQIVENSKAGHFADRPVLRRKLISVVSRVWQRLACMSNAEFGALSKDFYVELVFVSEILMRTATLTEIDPGFPTKFVLKIAALHGITESPALRHMACELFSVLPQVLVPPASLGSDLLHHFALVVLEVENLPKMFIVRIVDTFTDIDLVLDIVVPSFETYLYERAAHRIIELVCVDSKSLTVKVGWVVALSMLRRVSELCPAANLIETFFWRLTAAMKTMEVSHIYEIRPYISSILRQRGNRAVILDLWSMCDVDDIVAWRLALGDACRNIDFKHNAWPVDSLTMQPVRELFYFGESRDVSKGVGLETLLHHVAVNGWFDPFTNCKISWDAVLRSNPSLARL